MVFQPTKKDNQIIYYSAQIKNYLIVYGTRYLKRSELEKIFPNYRMCFIQQIHSDKVIPAQTKKLIKADAHWTCEKLKALVIQTADCLPIFMATHHQVCAIHAGWRGVEKKIALKALDCFSCTQGLEVSIGPHVTEQSFIVDEDVAFQLAQSAPQGKKYIFSQGSGKYRVSLTHLVQEQILSKTQIERWHLLPFNTFSKEIFYSFRRTSEKNIGQYGFVVKV